VSAATLPQRLLAEATGAALLLAAVVGSGIMAERLAGGNNAVALLCNTLPTAAMLVVLVTALAPISGAHLNPAVSLVFSMRREITAYQMALYVAAQIAGAILGVIIAHAMFGHDLLQISARDRSGLAQVFSEGVATFGLVLTILLTLRAKPQSLAACVGLYVGAAYWFTASTSFANPAVTIARALTNTFSGIQPADVAGFVSAQLVGAVCGMLLAHGLTQARPAGERVAQAETI
jgi:glycerol uptake facilitator-like aquaporin